MGAPPIRAARPAMSVTPALFEMLEARGWAVCDDSIAPALRQQLYACSEAAWQAGRFHPARIGRGEAATRDETVRGDSILWLERRHGDAVMDAFMDWAAQLRAELNQRYFLGLRREEFHFSHYPVGTGYRKHFDQHRGSPHRRISLVLYLNPEWDADDGGELAIHAADDDTRESARILPQGGRLVLFRSELIPHAVLPCRRPRRALTGWFRTDAAA
ncbi:proline hydroxylase [Cupriavidus sp. USMAA2-4]|nr:proline hydroxylase [Cupriavidus sp. USMAA2-4]